MAILSIVLAVSVLGFGAAEAQWEQYGLYDRPKDLTQVGIGWTPTSRYLLRPNTAMEYNNFGWERYRERGSGYDYFPAYDELGEPWLTGSQDVFRWVEDRTRAPDFSSSFSRNLGRHNAIVVARESFSRGALRLSVGDAIHTTFTSLTLDMSRFTGLRVDAVIGQNNQVTLIGTRPSDPRQRVRLNTVGKVVRDEGTTLAGGHWEGRFLQGALSLGGTLLNHHRFDSLRKTGSFLKGTLPVDMNPDTVIVRISDDSPLGGRRGGASVYGGRARINLRLVPGENRVVQGVRPVVVASEGARWVDGHWQVEGDDFIEHIIPVSTSALGVHNSTEVGRDYRIGQRQTHRAVDRSDVKEEIRHTPLVTRSRSGRDGGARRTVDFDHGLSTSMNIAGLNGRLDLGGLDLDWEWARSVQHFQFPEEELGERSNYTGNAFFVRGAQDWKKFSAGGEYFSVSPRYQSYALDDGDFNLGDQLAQTRDDFITREFMGNNFGFYFNEPQPNQLRSGREKRNSVFALVEDNDDDDQFQDQGQNDTPFAVRTQPLESGVYPGWDLNQDGVPDFNRNRNNIPDFAEPFFKFWQEEQVFYWGDDFNNNGVLDYFEDDSLPDYPYYKDERGTHVFLDWRAPVRGLSFRAGAIRVEQIAGPGNMDVNYLNASYRRNFPGRGRIRFEHQLKSVEDDIPNNTFQYVLQEDNVDIFATYESDFVLDALNMRNSLVNRGYLGTLWTPLRGLNVENNLRYEINDQSADQFKDGVVQKDKTLDTWALVNKVDYTWNWQRLSLKPMFKHTFLKQDAQRGTAPGGRALGRGRAQLGAGGVALGRDVSEVVPILMANYEFTDKTTLQLGAEGFPFLKERFIDRDNEILDFKAQTYLAQIKLKGNSGGFNVFIITGIQYTDQNFDEDEIESGSFVRSFFQVFVGEQILAAAR